MRTIHYLGFIIFLIVYGYFKYTAVPQLMGQSQYILTTGIVIVLTAIVPFFLSYFIARKVSSNARYVVLGLLPLLLCALGLAFYFYIFIAPNAPGMSVMQVLPRTIVPGLVMGALLLLPMGMRKA
jgi:hypothetical protein